MAQWLKQSTAVTIQIGPALDDTDGKTAETGLTITQADVRLSKNGAVFAQCNEATAASHDENGWYRKNLDATDTGTLGRLIVAVAESGALPMWREFLVVEADAFDAYLAAAGTGHVEADAVQVSGDATAADNAEAFFDGTGYAGTGNTIPTVTTVTNQVTADVTAISGDATAADNAEAWFDDTGFAATNSTIGTCTTNTDMRGTDNAALASVLGALADAAAAGDPTNADTAMQYLKQLINILTGTAGIATFPAEAAPGNNVSLAEVIRAIHVDVTGLNGDAMRGTDSAALAATALTNATWTDARAGYLDNINGHTAQTGDSFARLGAPAGASVSADIAALNDPTAAAVADAVWDEAKVGHVGAGSFGEEVQAHSLSSEISALNDVSTAEVNAEVVDALNTDTYAEPGQGAPGATISLAAKIGYLYKAFRNKLTQTATTLSIYNDAGAVVDQKATVSDDGTTFTRGEIGTGP